ncbi:MAG TPA: cytochrome b5 domain-containing protein [Coriobacteriia bacterium]|nr:cytochrome b5 domain-containing protein [Coriobacteriia bacterium]
MKEFTLEDLAKYDGKDGMPAYVAYKGVVYDVTESSMWPDGAHEAMHDAGADLTEAHDDAPHDDHIVDFPEVGRVV